MGRPRSRSRLCVENASDAYRCYESAKPFGKVGISIG
jgi:hypothetical protein